MDKDQVAFEPTSLITSWKRIGGKFMRRISLILIGLVVAASIIIGCATESEKIISGKAAKPKIYSMEIPKSVTIGQKFAVKFKFSADNIAKVIYSYEAVGTRERHVTGPFEVYASNLKISDSKEKEGLKECEFSLMIPTAGGVPFNYDFSVQLIDSTGQKSNKKTERFVANF